MAHILYSKVLICVARRNRGTSSVAFKRQLSARPLVTWRTTPAPAPVRSLLAVMARGKMRRSRCRCRAGHAAAAMAAAAAVLLLALPQQTSAASAWLAGRKLQIWQGDDAAAPATSVHTKTRSSAGSRAVCRNVRARGGSTLDNIIDHSNLHGSGPFPLNPLSLLFLPVMINS